MCVVQVGYRPEMTGKFKKPLYIKLNLNIQKGEISEATLEEAVENKLLEEYGVKTTIEVTSWKLH